jgi:ribosome maturation factor RimP
MASSSKELLLTQITAVAERAAGSEDIEVVDVEVLGGGRSRLVRIYIDKPGGVSHADCELVSQQVGAILDIEDVVPGGGYRLEVSSPGVERRLSRPRDFERFQGSRIKVLLREPVENQRRWEGLLTGFADGVVTLEPASGKPLVFNLDQVEKANLKFEW